MGSMVEGPERLKETETLTTVAITKHGPGRIEEGDKTTHEGNKQNSNIDISSGRLLLLSFLRMRSTLLKKRRSVP